MSMTDPIADFLTRIRNGIQAAHETVEIPASKLKVEMARILKEQGYINNYEVEAPTTDAEIEKIAEKLAGRTLLLNCVERGRTRSNGIMSP